MADTCGIGWGDGLSLLGALIGAGAGIFAAFLAVARQRTLDHRRHWTTVNHLISRLDGAGMLLGRDRGTDAPAAVAEVYRAFCALRDTSIALRTEGAAFATIAARMESTTVWQEINRLVQAETGIVALDATARAEEIAKLCGKLRAELEAAENT